MSVTLSLADVLATADLQTRTDRKYIVDAPRFADLLADLGAGMGVLEIAGIQGFRYESVYFDTPARDSYLGAAHGRRRRFKVRTRTYVDSGDCMLEVKVRTGRGETQKHRCTYDPSRRWALDDAAIDFVARHAPVPAGADLVPALVTSYSRRTFVELATGARVTADTGLVCSTPAGDSVALPDELLVETKSAGPPTAADRFLWRAGVRPVAISKFCVGMAALDPALPANKWNRILRQHFHGGL